MDELNCSVGSISRRVFLRNVVYIMGNGGGESVEILLTIKYSRTNMKLRVYFFGKTAC